MTGTPAKGAITITHTREDGTVLDGSRKGDGVYEIVSQHGFRFSRNVGIYIRGSQDKEAQHWRINGAAAALRAAGHTVTVTINEDDDRSFAEIEEAREERAEDRAERFGERAGRAAAESVARRKKADDIGRRFEGGQPILVDHYSAPAAFRAQERMHANMSKSIEEREKAGYWASRAEAAAAFKEHRNDPYRTLRRLKKLRAELRQQQRYHAEAVAKGWDSVDRHARLIRDLERDIAGWEEVIEKAKAEGVKVWTPDDFAPGDFVRMRGSWYEVIRVNPATLSIAWNLRLAPKPVMTREDATPPGYRLGTFTVDYTNVRGRCPGEVMRAYLADGKVPGTKTAHEASEKLPASAVRAAEAAKPKKKKRSDPKIPKRVKVECAQDRTTATLTFLTGRSQPHKDFQPVTLRPPEGEKFSEVMWANTLRAAAVDYLAGRGFRLRDAGWGGGSIQGASHAIEEIPAAEPTPEAAEDEKRREQAPTAEEQPAPAETCPMCHSGRWSPQARVCGHCHHNPTATAAPAPASAADTQDWRDAMAMVFIVSKNTRRARKRALWAMTRREAQAVCGDSRTSGRSYILTWSDHPGEEGTDWEWVPDNGSLDPVLADLGITPRREWTAARDAVATAMA
ncbi:DUF3560 domain-containing protein [Streptomyces rochei]|uniref:DUF3560 domain-containing protein n=1 Tax=Streptomyces rochei TaxID=1928 RepID=UPI00379E4A5E